MKTFRHKKPAFTLVEAILYTLIVTAISVTMILSLTEVIKARSVIERQREVVENLRFAESNITRLLRSGHEVATGTGSETSPAAIRVYLDESNSTYFDLDTNTKVVTLDGNSVAIRYLQYNLNSGTPVQITANTVSVQSFTLQDLTVATEPSNIQIQIQLQYAGGGGNSLTSQTSVSLRQ